METGKSKILTAWGTGADPVWWKSTAEGRKLKGATRFPFSLPPPGCTPRLPDMSGNLWKEAFLCNFLVISLQSSSPVSSKTAASVATVDLPQTGYCEVGVSVCVANAAGVLAMTYYFVNLGAC